jgi:hypothetical protein
MRITNETAITTKRAGQKKSGLDATDSGCGADRERIHFRRTR